MVPTVIEHLTPQQQLDREIGDLRSQQFRRRAREDNVKVAGNVAATDPSLFVLRHLIKFLEGYVAGHVDGGNDRYSYSNPENCLLAQYFGTRCGPDLVHFPECSMLVPMIWDIIACAGPNTYGAALARAKFVEERGGDYEGPAHD
jgi:hypothetical protein